MEGAVAVKACRLANYQTEDIQQPQQKTVKKKPCRSRAFQRFLK